MNRVSTCAGCFVVGFSLKWILNHFCIKINIEDALTDRLVGVFFFVRMQFALTCGSVM